MKSKDYIKLGFKYFNRNKRNSVNSIIIISIALVMFNLISGMMFGIKKSLNNSVVLNDNLKFIYVESKGDNILKHENIQEFSKISGVETAFERITVQVGLRNKDRKNITTLLAVPDEALKYFDNRLSKYNSKNSIILNEDIKEFSAGDNLTLDYSIKIDENSGIQGELPISVSQKYKQGNVLDLPPNVSLAPSDLVYDIKSRFYNVSVEDLKKNSSIDKIIVVVNNIDKLNEVADQIELKGYLTNYSMKASKDLPQFSKVIVGLSSIILIVLLLLSCTNINSTIKQNLNNRKREIGIMKALGFKSTHILKILLSEMTCLVIATFIVSIISSFVVIFAINKFVIDTSVSISKIDFNYIQILLSFIMITVVVNLSTIKNIVVTSKLNPIDIIREE
ncbi:ABC-type transport system, involved in lipoprotein release, permease component [Clostridium sp. USBA 49]|uniref:ABC transporter permease n=1 Tax=Clostridium sp. USBA 49 TaxID=1881060 RepID=UPI00099A58B9|nr:ABC transporter permease [Clostridium sp. USBA 49]SKA92155.1 ABC-type transport system, involved in lipoprotein release, permease component [Clostridium sp. USBA 49]